MLAGHQENGEKGPKPVLDIAQQKTEPVERSAVRDLIARAWRGEPPEAAVAIC